jgi:hypothetical protein
MCDPITATIAAVTVVSAGVGMAASIGAANANMAAARYEAQQQERQLYRQREMDRVAALQKENARAAEFDQSRSAAIAAIGASGLGEHISFFQSIDPQAKKAFLRDVRTVRLNMTAERASIADQVGVTEYKRDIAVFNAKMSKVGAVADFVKTAMSAASFAAGNATPKPAPAASPN